jgi:NitT/TauT family transport system ATP-binding protein
MEPTGHLLARDICLSFDGAPAIEVLHSITLEIKPHEILGLLGPSGCGKSTLLNVLAGFIPPNSGTITLDGQTIGGPSPDRGVVFQNHSLFPWKTVRGNVEFATRARTKGKGVREEIIKRVIDVVGLSGFEGAFPVELSGGMAQRVGIARMLASDPKVMLMDEPFGSLDAQTRAQMQQVFLDIWSKYTKSVLFVTHDIDEAILLADRLAVMSARPARIIEEIDVRLPRPRTESQLFSPEAIALREHLYSLLRPLASL